MKEIVKLGSETGAMTAAVWCPEHDVKSTIHPIGEFVEEAGQVRVNLQTPDQLIRLTVSL